MSTEKARWAKLAGLPEIKGEKLKIGKKKAGFTGKQVKILQGKYKGEEGKVLGLYRFGNEILAKIDIGSMSKTINVNPDYLDLLESKQQLDENVVGIGMVGNIFDREKEQYEDAFEHFLSERYEEKVEENYATEVKDAWSNLDMDTRVELLLAVYDDPDIAEMLANREFDALPEAAKANMRMDMM